MAGRVGDRGGAAEIGVRRSDVTHTDRSRLAVRVGLDDVERERRQVRVRGTTPVPDPGLVVVRLVCQLDEVPGRGAQDDDLLEAERSVAREGIDHGEGAVLVMHDEERVPVGKERGCGFTPGRDREQVLPAERVVGVPEGTECSDDEHRRQREDRDGDHGRCQTRSSRLRERIHPRALRGSFPQTVWRHPSAASSVRVASAQPSMISSSEPKSVRRRRRPRNRCTRTVAADIPSSLPTSGPVNPSSSWRSTAACWFVERVPRAFKTSCTSPGSIPGAGSGVEVVGASRARALEPRDGRPFDRARGGVSGSRRRARSRGRTPRRCVFGDLSPASHEPVDRSPELRAGIPIQLLEIRDEVVGSLPVLTLRAHQAHCRSHPFHGSTES